MSDAPTNSVAFVTAWLPVAVATMAMFPLGSVLFPSMPLQLRVFEPRYLTMLAELLKHNEAEFGVVLIERGQEVGGGEQRFDVGTVAQIVQLASQDGFVILAGRGGRRIRVDQWLDDDPYPRAEVTDLPVLSWSEELLPLRQRTESVVRRTLAIASEFTRAFAADVELSDNPLDAAWQLAGISPVSPLDQVRLLRSTSMVELLHSIATLSEDVRVTFSSAPPEDQ